MLGLSDVPSKLRQSHSSQCLEGESPGASPSGLEFLKTTCGAKITRSDAILKARKREAEFGLGGPRPVGKA